MHCRRLTESPSPKDYNNLMWRTERRLVEVIDRLGPIEKMGQQLEEVLEIVRRNPCYHLALPNPDNSVR